jgi:hypothetical protein
LIKEANFSVVDAFDMTSQRFDYYYDNFHIFADMIQNPTFPPLVASELVLKLINNICN